MTRRLSACRLEAHAEDDRVRKEDEQRHTEDSVRNREHRFFQWKSEEKHVKHACNGERADAVE